MREITINNISQIENLEQELQDIINEYLELNYNGSIYKGSTLGDVRISDHKSTGTYQGAMEYHVSILMNIKGIDLVDLELVEIGYIVKDLDLELQQDFQNHITDGYAISDWQYTDEDIFKKMDLDELQELQQIGNTFYEAI